jgi:hypothetical protein
LVQKRSWFLVAAAVVIVVGLSTVIAVTGGFNNNQAASAPLPQAQTPVAPVVTHAEAPKASLATVTKTNRPERKEERRTRQEEKRDGETAKPNKEPEQVSQSIKVVMQIENGRVLKASIANPKPGMDSYEALALRIARQRRYSATTSGAETVTISVNK